MIDMPPGTGDVQLTLCQDLELSGAVTVTTPSKLAATDAIKGIEMFTSLGVPTLAMVENMSYFDVSVMAKFVELILIVSYIMNFVDSAKEVNGITLLVKVLWNPKNYFKMPILI